MALSGYAREADACAGLNRETWTRVPPGLSAADAARVRAGHPLWQAIIDLPHGPNRETRLVWAASRGKLARVRELCDWGADVEARDMHGGTPLFIANLGDGRLDIMRELMKRGANVNAVTKYGLSTLHVAVLLGRLDLVRELLAHGADIEASGHDGWTPLLVASWKGYGKIVRALLAAGADKWRATNDGDTAHDLASMAVGAPAASRRAIHALLAAAP